MSDGFGGLAMAGLACIEGDFLTSMQCVTITPSITPRANMPTLPPDRDAAIVNGRSLEAAAAVTLESTVAALVAISSGADATSVVGGSTALGGGGGCKPLCYRTLWGRKRGKKSCNSHLINTSSHSDHPETLLRVSYVIFFT
jgi:hypothetical protein